MPKELLSKINTNGEQAIIDILLKNKLIADLVHKQDMPHHDLVETLARKESMAKLKQILNNLPAQENGSASIFR